MMRGSLRRLNLELTTNRIQALTDGVYAIAMTLLVLNLDTSEYSSGYATETLVGELKVLWPQVFHYFQSFLILAAFWMEHHQQFHFIKRADRNLFWINIVGLLFITLLPFSTELVGDHGNLLPAVLIFDVNLLMVGIVYFFHWSYATRNNRLVDKDMDPSIVKYYKYAILVIPVITLLSMSLAFINPRWSTLVLLIIPSFMLLYKRY